MPRIHARGASSGSPARSRRGTPRPRERLIVALDTSDRSEARRLVRALRGKVGLFKVGLQLFTAHGPAIVRDIVAQGDKVFLDLKLHDIPNTVAHAVAEGSRLGASLMTVHVPGGEAMMRAAAEAAAAARPRGRRTRIVGVTVLTSLDAAALAAVGILEPLPGLAVKLALLARSCGLDGVVTSGHEVEGIKSACGGSFLAVVPGIRPSGAGLDDQKRATTPAGALLAGADYIVVGRPITGADDPTAAAEAILHEMGG
jgi:orotidine-5'-phosphate decarboxylase